MPRGQEPDGQRPGGQEPGTARSEPSISRRALRAAAALAASWLVLAGSLVLAGWFVTHGLGGRVDRWDEHVNAWFAHRRTSIGNRVTGDLTLVANAPGILAGTAVVVAVTAWRHRIRLATLLVIGLVVEFTAFLATNYLVARPRPQVAHLGSTPSTFSWPSGHVAATVVLYGGLALITAWVTRRVLWRLVAWGGAAALVVCVGLARIYRGDHHLTDTVGGLLLGGGALAAAVLVVAVWTRSARPRAGTGAAAASGGRTARTARTAQTARTSVGARDAAPSHALDPTRVA